MYPSVPVTPEMLAHLRQDRIDIENRLRFSGTCIEGACVQWTGTCCGLIERAVIENVSAVPVDILPKCTIRPSCRWFAQRGRTACAIYPAIIRKPSSASLGVPAARTEGKAL